MAVAVNVSEMWQVTGDMWHMPHDTWHASISMFFFVLVLLSAQVGRFSVSPLKRDFSSFGCLPRPPQTTKTKIPKWWRIFFSSSFFFKLSLTILYNHRNKQELKILWKQTKIPLFVIFKSATTAQRVNFNVGLLRCLSFLLLIVILETPIKKILRILCQKIIHK